MRARLRAIVLLSLLTSSGCASMSALQKAQVSHDALALAQDTESTLCYGMPLLQAMATPVVAAAPNHCPAPAAATLGWTDARHQDFNKFLKQAIDAQTAFTRVLASGAAADPTDLNHWIGTILAILGNLPQADATIQSLTVQVSKARIK